MAAQVSPLTTRWKAVQPSTIPGSIGAGVGVEVALVDVDASVNDVVGMGYTELTELVVKLTYLYTASATTDSSTSTKGLCLPDTNLKNTEKVTAQLQPVSSSNTKSAATDGVVEALSELQAFSRLYPSSCNETIQFALPGDAAVGIYVGAELSGQGALSTVLHLLVDQIQTEGFSDSVFVQLCDSSGRSSCCSLGVMAVTGSDLASAHQAVQTWKNDSCVSTTAGQTAQAWQDITFRVPSLSKSSTSSNSTMKVNSKLRRRDDECTMVQVVSGDSCSTLAAECGVTGADFEKYNDDDICSTLTPGRGDWRQLHAIAAAYILTIDEIESYNNDTWGWMGCDDLLANMNICLSTGWPPMPTEIENAVCGPQVPGTPVASHGTNLSTLNECPLNACCDIWGQCGTTADFCTISQSPTGAPETAAVSENRCISNCGTDIILSSVPSEIYSVAYFEGFDWSRPCLTMSISEVDTSSYTHIHFAFATISPDFTLNITSIESQLPFFSARTTMGYQ
ncbi:hypothetical protein BDV12DRAFT_195884 [Aspergillus spectabilis]